ncbi:MAG: LysM peptidoglycan-binding domain-containing M23 family metallopeptidase [Defluviicoccus sp.]
MVISVTLARLCRIAGVLSMLLSAGCGWVELGTPETGAEAGARPQRPRLPAAKAARPDTATLPAVRMEPKRIRVQPGDTVESLAVKHSVSVQAMIETNNLGVAPVLTPGQTLVLPAEPEHVVRQGETLPAIARRYGLDPTVLAAENGLTQPYTVRKGQRLRLPAAAPTGSAAAPTYGPAPGPAVRNAPAVAAARPAVETGAEETEAWAAEQQTAAAMPSSPALPPAPSESGHGFIWPVRGKVISAFGPKGKGLHNDGINIAARKGTAVRAVENGVVAYVGNELRAFGNLVLIKHRGGWVSTYAHAEEILVARGDRVKKGQTIARVGNSGNAREPQLHFELRRGKTAVDPLEYLPRGKA